MTGLGGLGRLRRASMPGGEGCTLIVNAVVMNKRQQPLNAPWAVDVQLLDSIV
jgi:hypothetical protein